MKKITVILLIAALAVSLAACGFGIGKSGDTDGDKTNAVTAAENDSGEAIVIGGQTVKLTSEARHGDMIFKENTSEMEIAGYDQVCNLNCTKDGVQLFIIRMVYFKGRSVDEVMSGSDNEMTDKTVNGLEYKYFEYEENGTPGRSYVYNYEGTTYVIELLSEFDMTSLEEVFMNNVRFEKE